MNECTTCNYMINGDDMDERIQLTREQESAIKSLERALKKCATANVFFHNCYGRLLAYDGDVVDCVDDNEDELDCNEGDSVEMYGYNLDSWADDRHYIHLIDNG